MTGAPGGRAMHGARTAPHVLMTADAVGGVWTYALELSRALAARGSRVSLAVMGPSPSPAQRAGASLVPGLEVHARTYRLEWMDDPWEDVRDAGGWLLELERRLEPDVVHLNGYCHAALAWRAPAIVVAHSCVLSWWRAVRGTDAPASWSRYAADAGRGLRAASLVVSPTAAMLGALEACHGRLPRTRVIANGRSASTAAQVAKEPFVLSVGRLWDDAKNLQALCQVAPHLDWPVYAAGETGEQTAPRMPLDGGVRHLGVLEPAHVASWMARAAIYALPARYEPFGLSALEAALAGCALVLGDIPSLREVWGDAALYAAPDDHRGLANTLSALIDDASLRERMAARAGVRARQLTPGRMADAYVDAYGACETISRQPDRVPGVAMARSAVARDL